ncbi:MAG TPA: hypothetical protein HA349_11390 [Methanotrichaceae archaeon]|nr:hypothetical protein [Methanotrichaceae archaeon]
MQKRHFNVITILAIAVAVMVFGPVAAGTVWSPGIYGIGYGSVSWPSQDVSTTKEVVQLGGSASQASPQKITVAAVQLGSYSNLVSSQIPASGSVQLSGYYENMGNYKNILFRPILGGNFGSAGGAGGCCGG